MIDTAKDARLGRTFLNRTMRAYPAFTGFYGMEETIERIVGFFRHAAQGLEERKQILYLLGPVGGGKSSLAERLKSLMEVHPIYVLEVGDELSPVFESPLSLFDPESLGPMIEEKYGIPRRRLHGLMSPWCYKRLEALGGDISGFRVAKIRPSRLRQIAVAKTEPGDENNQDISSLVGKVDIRKLETFAQNDPDAYSYSGGLNRSNQGVLEFVEMFKAPIKMLHPLLTATQEGNYIGTENIGAIPFTGVILAHSNESASLMAMRRTSWIDHRINDGVALIWLLPWLGVWFFLAAADWHDGGSPPSWRRRTSPWKRGDASHARICSRCGRARTRSWRSQNCPRLPTDGLRPPPVFRSMLPLGTRW